MRRSRRSRRAALRAPTGGRLSAGPRRGGRRVAVRPAVATRPSVAARAAVARTRQSQCGCSSKYEVAFDVGGRATVQPVENPLAILLANLVQQLVGADDSGLVADLSSQELRHRLRKLTTLHDASRRPYARASKRSMLPPPSLDDDEITPAEDRDRPRTRVRTPLPTGRDSGAQFTGVLSPARRIFYVRKVL